VFDGKKAYPIDPTSFHGFEASDTSVPVLSDQRIEQQWRITRAGVASVVTVL
jgi:hypothetical protein